jgi:hypothetical protein
MDCSRHVMGIHLQLQSSLLQVSKGLAALELGVLDDTYKTGLARGERTEVMDHAARNIPASASLEKWPLHST